MENVTKYQYLKIYFQVYSLQPNVKKLTPNEIKTIAHLIIHDNTNPYYGEGRDLMLKKTGLATTTYSTCLKKLSQKNFLVKTKEDDGYALHPSLITLKEKVLSNSKLPIINWYNII